MKITRYDESGLPVQCNYATIPANWSYIGTTNGVDHYVRTDGTDFYVEV